MIGHIVAEDRFLHQGIDHHLFVVRSEQNESEFRFEVRRTTPGGDHPESIYEKTVDLSGQLGKCPNTTMDQLVTAELDAIKRKVSSEEDIHVHDP